MKRHEPFRNSSSVELLEKAEELGIFLPYQDSIAPLDLMNFQKLNPAKCCNACSCCTDLMRNNQVTGCVIRDRSIYKKAGLQQNLWVKRETR